MVTNKEEVLNILKQQAPYLAQQFHASSLSLFGSFVNGPVTPSSDIDLCVEFSQPIGFDYYNFILYLQNIFQRKVDVLTPTGIDSIRNDTIRLTIKKSLIHV